MKKIPRLLPLMCGALALLAAGCGTGPGSIPPPPPGVEPVLAQFFLEIPRGDPATARALPVSGLRVPIDPGSPVLNRDGGDIAGVRVGRSDPQGLYMVFQLTGGAVNAFTQMTVSHQGYRLVMALNGVPVAATVINGPISNGVLSVFPEFPNGSPDLKEDQLRELQDKQIHAIADGINYVCMISQIKLNGH